MPWLSFLHRTRRINDDPPPWSPSPEKSRANRRKRDGPQSERLAAKLFCRDFPIRPASLLPSVDVERIESEGCSAWSITKPPCRFRGSITNEGNVTRIASTPDCEDICLMSSLPLMGGLYEISGKAGVYYEVKVVKMEGSIAIGMACQPYPMYRFPGRNRGSVALQLDDLEKYCGDGLEGQPYDQQIKSIAPGDVVGCGYDFRHCSLFYTYNGDRLETAYRGVFLPRETMDVFAGIGVGGEGANEVTVNFGADHDFAWKPGRSWAWLVEGHVGRLSTGFGEELPPYEE